MESGQALASEAPMCFSPLFCGVWLSFVGEYVMEIMTGKNSHQWVWNLNNEIAPQEAKTPQVLGNSALTWLVVVSMPHTLAKLQLAGKSTSRATQHMTNVFQTLKIQVEEGANIEGPQEENGSVGSIHEKINPDRAPSLWAEPLWTPRPLWETDAPYRVDVRWKGSRHACEAWSPRMQRWHFINSDWRNEPRIMGPVFWLLAYGHKPLMDLFCHCSWAQVISPMGSPRAA